MPKESKQLDKGVVIYGVLFLDPLALIVVDCIKLETIWDAGAEQSDDVDELAHLNATQLQALQCFFYFCRLF